MRLASALAVLLFAASAHAEVSPAPDPNRWNLADLYPTVADWHADVGRLQAQIKEFESCKGQLGKSVKRFKACADLQADLNKRFGRLYVYSSQTLDENNELASSIELDQKAKVLGAQIGQASSFFAPEVLKLGRKKIEGYLAADKSLGIYRHGLDDILRGAPHILDDKGEALIANFQLTAGAPGDIYQTLSTTNVPWPTIKLSDGNPARLDQAGYTRYRAVQNRDDRKKVFDAFWGKWKEYEQTFGATFYASLQTALTYARARDYKDSITMSLDGSNVPVAVYDTLIAETRKNLPTLHRYFKLRGRMLGVKEPAYYDIYPPIVKSDLKFPIAEGKRMMLESLAPLGPEYVAEVRKGIEQRWMDVYPRPKKSPGAHMAGYAYDVHPYLLLNYNDDYESVSTLTHEWGHALHTQLAKQAQPFVNANYATFTAEIASTFNEALMLDYTVKNARSEDEKLYYLGFALENLRGTFFRQAMFADFEREVHARVDRGEPLTGEGLTKIYGDILRSYHGHAEGVMKIEDVYAMEWAYIPHFYSPYYVFQYATSIAASAQFADEVMAGKPGARERYLGLLRAGGSDYPYDLVKAAGVDLASPAPYRALAARMDRIMDQIEAILAKQGK